MNVKTFYRFLIDLCILLCVIFGLWFIALPLGLVALWLYPYYFEIIPAGIAYDALFGLIPSIGIWGYVGTIVSISIFIIITAAKRVVRK